MFNQPGIVYLDRPMFHGSWELPDYVVQQIKQHNLTIIDLSSEHWGADGLETAYKNFERMGINFLLLSHDTSDHKRHKRLLYYPHWYFYSIKNFVLPQDIPTVKSNSWSCLNLNPRPHRIYNFILSKQKPYFNQAIFSMHNSSVDQCSRVDDPTLDQHTLNQWHAIKDTLKHKNDTPDGLSLTIPALLDSYIHLVTESTVLHRVFITEKTWKTIAMEQIFLVLGNPGTISTLRDLGVDVFDDIVDHSYDCELDWEKRVNMIHRSLESLLLQDLHLIYQSTKTRRELNRIKFKNKEFGLHYQQDLAEAINEYL